MTTIPANIWMHVAHFIPPSDLRSLSSVNSALFQLAMDIKYHKAGFYGFNDAAGLDRTYRFRDPFIAHRVRRIDVNPGYWAGAWDRHQRHSNGISSSLQENIQTITDTVACLTNVTEFSIEYTFLPFRQEHLLPFLFTAWETFGSSLLRLSFNGRTRDLPGIISTAEGLTDLRHLHICMRPPAWTVDTNLMITCLAPFVNKVAPTLHTLSLDTEVLPWESSLFFLQLRHIPNLEVLILSVNYDVEFISDPLGLTRFLHNHAASLRHVHWNETSMHSLSHKVDQCLVNWLSECAADEVALSNLQTLSIPLPRISAGFSLSMDCIGRSATTLTSLELWNHTLSYKEVDTLVSVLARHRTGKFRRLTLKVEHLFPELILLLAQTLPRLEGLGIRINNIGQLNGSQERPPANPEEKLVFEQNFADTMRTYDIRDWPLRDIEISVLGVHDNTMGARLMHVLVECVPSARFREENKSPS